MKHSGLGIASFILSLAMDFVLLGLIVFAAIMEVIMTGGIDEESTVGLVLGFIAIAAGFMHLVAVGLGIAALLQSNRHKVFAVLGTVFSSLGILLVVAFYLIGHLTD